FHCREVASERVATRLPFEVLRTSGSAPRLPIRMTLFRDLLMVCSSVAWNSGLVPGNSGMVPAPDRAWGHRSLRRGTVRGGRVPRQDQRVLRWSPIIAPADARRSKPDRA